MAKAKFERTKPLPESIYQAVLAKKGGDPGGGAQRHLRSVSGIEAGPC